MSGELYFAHINREGRTSAGLPSRALYCPAKRESASGICAFPFHPTSPPAE